MAGTDRIEHLAHLIAHRRLLFGGEAVVAGVDLAGVGLDAQGRIAVEVVENPALALGDAHIAEFAGGELIAPVAEGAFGELHDVALVHQRHVALGPLQPQGVLNRLADVSLAAVLAHRLDADARALRDLAVAELAVGRDHRFVEVADQLQAHRIVGLPLDAHINIFGVLAVHDHIKILRPLVGTGGAFVVAAGAHAAIQIEDLSQGHIQGADAATHRGGEGPLDRHAVLADRREGVLRQVLIGAVELAGLIAGEHLEPLDTPLAAVGLRHRRIEHPLGGGPDVHTGAIAADEGDDRVVGHHRQAALEADRSPLAGGGELLVGGHGIGGDPGASGSRAAKARPAAGLGRFAGISGQAPRCAGVGRGCAGVGRGSLASAHLGLPPPIPSAGWGHERRRPGPQR